MGQSLSFHHCRERRRHVKYFRDLCSLARLAELSGPVFAVCWSLVCNFHGGLQRVSVKRHLQPWISGLINQHTLMNASSSCATQAFLCCRVHTQCSLLGVSAGSLCFSQNTHTLGSRFCLETLLLLHPYWSHPGIGNVSSNPSSTLS